MNHGPDAVRYAREENLELAEFREVLIDSTLGARRPVDDEDRLRQMLRHGNLTITARVGGRLVGVARSLSDFSFATYLSDLAVVREHQGHGIGTELIRQTKLAAPQAVLILLSAPAAVNFYPRIGMSHHPHAFVLSDVAALGAMTARGAG